MVVTSLTFGVGHIINLFNGRGMSLGSVLIQIVFAVLLGFLFVMVYLRSGSLIPCILSHQAINILSAFANKQSSGQTFLVLNFVEIAVILLYLGVLVKMPTVSGEKKSLS